MVLNQAGREIPKEYAEHYGIFEGELAHINSYKEASRNIKPKTPRETKLLSNLREAIERTGLKDGMTISFHHHFREGDQVMNKVLAEISAMGIKDLTIAPSSIANIHEPLIDYIKKWSRHPYYN